MWPDSWPARLAQTIARQTPAYRAAGLNRFAWLGAPAERPRVDRNRVRDLARTVVAQLAPAELPAFRAVSEAYFADSRWALAGGGRIAPLEFGPGRAERLLTWVVLAVVTEVVRGPAKSGPEVDRVALETARRNGLSDEEAYLIRDAVVGAARGSGSE
jgi:hypothetical protein